MSTILLTALSVLGWALAVLLCLLLLALFTPARLVLELRYDAFCARLKVLCFTFTLYPRRQKAQGGASGGEAGPAVPQEEGTRPDGGSGAQDGQPQAGQRAPVGKKAANKRHRLPSLGSLAQICSAAGALMRAVLRAVHVRDVKAVWPVHCGDAAETAIRFGRTQAYVGSALGVLQNFVDLQLRQVDIIPDFTGEHKYRRYFYCKIQATPFIIVTTGVWALVKLKAMRAI
jgi:hypothetical protein